MTVCMYIDIHTLQPYIIDFTQRGCHTLRYEPFFRILLLSIILQYYSSRQTKG